MNQNSARDLILKLFEAIKQLSDTFMNKYMDRMKNSHLTYKWFIYGKSQIISLLNQRIIKIISIAHADISQAEYQ